MSGFDNIGGNNGSGNGNKPNFEYIDEALRQVTQLEQKLGSISNSVDKLAQKSIEIVSNISSSIRGSQELFQNGYLESAGLNLNHLAGNIQIIKKLMEDIKDLSENIKNAEKIDQIGDNFNELNGKISTFIETLKSAGANYSNLASTLTENAPETTKRVAVEFETLGRNLIEVFSNISKSAEALPQSAQDSLNELVEMVTNLQQISKEASKSLSDIPESIPKDNQANQYFRDLYNSIEELAKVTQKSGEDVSKLLETIDGGKEKGKELANIYREISLAVNEFNLSTMTNKSDDLILKKKDEIMGLFEKFKTEYNNALESNISNLSIEKVLELSQHATNTAQKVKTLYSALDTLNQSKNFSPDVDYKTIGHESYIDTLSKYMEITTRANFDPALMYQKQISSELNFDRRDRTALSRAASKLEKEAGVLIGHQLNGEHYGFAGDDIAESAKRLQGLNYKRDQIQQAFNAALADGDPELVKKLFPDMVKTQQEINKEALKLSKFLPNDKNLKNLPDEVRSIVGEINKIIKAARASNETLISIGVSTDKKELEEYIKTLSQVNTQLAKTGEEIKTMTDRVAGGLLGTFSTINSITGGANKVLGALGLGSMLSATALLSRTIEASRSQGQLEKDMALVEFAGFGAEHSQARFNTLYELGLGDNRLTNGLIGTEDYARSFNAYARGIQGQYGAGNDADAMDQFARTSVLIQRAYGVSDTSTMNAINTFYKELKISATEVNNELLKMGATAEQINVPFDKYLNQVASLAINFRNIGIDGKAAANVIATLMQGGMSNEMAMQYATGLGSAMTRMSPGMMAYAGVMSGASPTFYDAVGDMQMLWDANGDINTANVAKLARSFGWYGDMMSGAFSGAGHNMIMMQVLMGQLGMSQRDASITLSRMNQGESLSSIMEMYNSGSGAFANKEDKALIDSQNQLRDAIAKASDNLSGVDKSLNAYNNVAQTLAHSNEDLLRKTTDVSKAIYVVGDQLDNLSGVLKQHEIALWALVATMAIGPGNFVKGAVKGIDWVKNKSLRGGGRTGGSGGVPEATGRTGSSKWLGKIGKVGKGAGWLGLGLTAVTLGADLLLGDGKSSTPATGGVNWIGGGMPSALDPNYAYGGSPIAGLSSGYNPYADINQYNIEPSQLGGQGGRFAKNAANAALFGASFIPYVGWGIAGASAILNLTGGMDAIFGTSDSSILKKYGSGLEDLSKEYSDYLFNTQGGLEVDKTFALVAAKGISDASGKGGLLLNKSMDQKAQFGTAYAKAIADGKSENEALIIAERALNGGERMQALSREQVQTAIQSLLVQQSSGADINAILKNEMPKTREETLKSLNALATVTGTKVDELRVAIENSGVSVAQVIAQLKKDGSMGQMEKEAEKIEISEKISNMIKNELGLNKKEQEKATQGYIANREFLDTVMMTDELDKIYLKAIGKGKSNEEALREIAMFQTGPYAFSSTIGEKPILSDMLKEYKKSDVWKSRNKNALFHGEDADNVLRSFANALGISLEAVDDHLDMMNLNRDEVATMLYDLRQQEIEQKYPGRKNYSKRLEISSKEQYSGVYDLTGIASEFGNYSDIVDKRLEELKKKQEEANDYLSKIANNTTVGITGVSYAATVGAGTSLNLTGGILEKAMSLIGANEGSYSSVNPNDAGKAMSLGKMQWHGSRAKGLLNKIYDANPGLFNSPALSGIVADLSKSDSFWNSRKATAIEASALKQVLGSQTAVEIQNQLAANDTTGYLNYARQKYGITDENTLLMAADIINQSGYGGFDRLASRILASGQPITMNTLDQFARNSSSAISDPNRRNRTYQAIAGGISPNTSIVTGTPDSEVISSIGSIAGDYNSSSTFLAIDAGIGLNNPYANIGDISTKMKYASNLYGRGYQTLASGMYNTQEFSLSHGETTKKLQHEVNVDLKADKIFNNPKFIQDLTKAFEKVVEKHGAEITNRFGEEFARYMANRFGY